MKYVTAKECTVIPLGRQGENLAETVLFNVSGWAELYGEGSFALLHQRCSDTAPYECPITVEDGVVNWAVRNADTALVGYGTAELVYVVGGTVAKSVIYQTSTLKSIDGSAEFPDPYDDWLREMHEDAEYVREHIEEALECAEESEAWAVGQRSGVDVDETDPTYQNNSKYYAWRAGNHAEIAEGYAGDAAESAEQAAAFVGAPLVANTASAMTDKTRIYVYVGSQTGYTAGNWYYWNGSAWISGGVYNSIADDIASNSDIDSQLYS